jgi:hypothetical protein
MLSSAKVQRLARSPARAAVPPSMAVMRFFENVGCWLFIRVLIVFSTSLAQKGRSMLAGS